MAQQTINVGTGVETGDGEISRTAWIKVNANFTDVYAQIATLSVNLGSLGTAAALNVGVTVGTVADGGALTAETSRATAAETANATAISAETTRATAAEAALQAAIGQTSTVYAVNYTAQTLAPAAQLQARQNIGALASGDAALLGNGSTATTQAAGDNTNKVATDAFVTGALNSYAGTVSATYLTQAAAASTYLTQANASSTYLTQATASSTYAPLASPALTGSPTAPTQAVADNSTKLATTAYVDRAATAAPYVISETLSTGSRVRRWSSGLIEMSGSTVLTTSSAGVGTITLPVAFPTVQISPSVMNGDHNQSTTSSNPFSIIGPTAGAYPLAQIQFVVPNNTSKSIRVNWRTEGY